MVGLIETTKSLVKPFVAQRRREVRKHSEAIKGWFQFQTPQIRVLPDFIIIGAQKCGTTSLYAYLAKHPNVVPALEKEIHFFDQHFSKGLNWYRAHFPSSLYKSYAKNISKQELITGEASPYYIFYPHAPKRIFDIVPQVKLIVLLRNPVSRAYSHYNHQVFRGRETLSFEEGIAAEPERLAGELDKIMADENYLSFNHVHFSYLSRGIYVDQFKAWLDVFPREQFLILGMEEFFANTTTVYQQVLEFLNLPNHQLSIYKQRNKGSYQKMRTETRQKLIEYFRPHNQRLYEFLGMEFDWDR